MRIYLKNVQVSWADSIPDRACFTIRCGLLWLIVQMIFFLGHLVSGPGHEIKGHSKAVSKIDIVPYGLDPL